MCVAFIFIYFIFFVILLWVWLTIYQAVVLQTTSIWIINLHWLQDFSSQTHLIDNTKLTDNKHREPWLTSSLVKITNTFTSRSCFSKNKLPASQAHIFNLRRHIWGILALYWNHYVLLKLMDFEQPDSCFLKCNEVEAKFHHSVSQLVLHWLSVISNDSSVISSVNGREFLFDICAKVISLPLDKVLNRDLLPKHAFNHSFHLSLKDRGVYQSGSTGCCCFAKQHFHPQVKKRKQVRCQTISTPWYINRNIFQENKNNSIWGVAMLGVGLWIQQSSYIKYI